MRGLARHGMAALPVLVLSLVLAAGASAATFEPTRTDDPNPGQCRPDDCSLREAARAAVVGPGNDRVVLSGRTYELEQPENGDGDTLGGDLDLFNTGTIEIAGKGAGKTTIDAAGVDRVFEVFEGARVEIRGLTMLGGAATGPEPTGGAISNEARLTLRNVVVRDNQAEGGGGGLRNEMNANAKVIGSTFRENETGEFGDGGAIDNREQARISITGSKFLSNSAGSDGGGLSNQNQARMTLRRSTVSGNFNPPASDGRAGGIFNQNDAQLTVVDSTISGNEAETIGGAMFIQNNAVARFKNSTISGNEAGEDGGGFYVGNWPTLSISFTTIANNTAASVGGAIFDATSTPGMSTPQPPYLIFRASIVAENGATVGSNCSVAQAEVWESKGANVEEGEDSCLFAEGNDLPDADALLRPLDRNGGPTMTHALRPASDAVDAAPKRGCPKRDQRGVERPQGPRCDGGAYELR